MSITPDSSAYLKRMEVLMGAGARVGGVLPIEHVQRFFRGEDVARWNEESENAKVLEVFWGKLMQNDFERGAVGFTILAEVEEVCAGLEEQEQIVALKEAKRLVESGTKSYDFDENLIHFMKRWQV